MFIFLSARDETKYKEKVTNITMSMYKPDQRYFSKNCAMGYQRITYSLDENFPSLTVKQKIHV
jgi:hypothetical protein